MVGPKGTRKAPMKTTQTPPGRGADKKTSTTEMYRRLLRMPTLKDFEVEEIRKNMQAIARAVCEHVWGKNFY